MLPNLNMKIILFVALGTTSAIFAFGWMLETWRTRNEPEIEVRVGRIRLPTLLEIGIGFATNFFDALGIGSYASTTSLFKLGKLLRDERIPGTLNVGHALPVIVEAFVFIAFVQVEVRTLTLMIIGSLVGAWLGAGIVAAWSRRKIQIGMGIALLASAVFFMMANLGLFPEGGNGLSLSGLRLIVGIAGNAFLGALMTLGIGLYAPCMILVGLLGMNTKAAFPIMMGSCAFVMPIASLRFIRKQSYSFGPGLGLTLGGLPAVLIAAFIIKSLPLVAVRWMVVLVVIYTAVRMLGSAAKESRQGGE
jgi:uncharacterized membrane protein YfcA